MGEGYRFDDASYRALNAAGITWQEALYVLHTPPRVRSHIGAVLRVARQTAEGRWIAVALIEEADDDYLIVGGHELDAAETAAAKKMIEGTI